MTKPKRRKKAVRLIPEQVAKALLRDVRPFVKPGG